MSETLTLEQQEALQRLDDLPVEALPAALAALVAPTTDASKDLELTAEQFDHLVETLAHAAEQLNEAIAMLSAAERGQ